MKKSLLIFVLLIFFGSIAHGDEIYKCVDANGKVVFTTKPFNDECKRLSGSAQEKEPKEVQQRKAPPPRKKQKWVVLKADALQSLYEQNELSADKKFKNKKFGVVGKIANISHVFGQLSVALDAGKFNQIQCFFDRQWEDQLSDLKKGETVAVVGICNGISRLRIVFSKSIIVSLDDVEIHR